MVERAKDRRPGGRRVGGTTKLIRPRARGSLRPARRRKGMQRNGRASRRSETPARAWNAPG